MFEYRHTGAKIRSQYNWVGKFVTTGQENWSQDNIGSEYHYLSLFYYKCYYY